MRWGSRALAALAVALVAAVLAAPLPAREPQSSAPAPEAEVPALTPGLEPPPDEPGLPPGLGAPPEPPALPPGLGEPDGEGAPGLPAGLGEPAGDEPALPSGLEAEPPPAEAAAPEPSAPFWARLPDGLSGFVEARAGARLRHDPDQSDDFTLGELRLQGEYERRWGSTSLEARGDLLLDAVLDHTSWDQRVLRLVLRPARRLDLSVGRQILTWGTGDLLFINDLFPKDWKSFFSGRDDEYLKAPSDALRVGIFGDALNLDLVYTPRFDPDRHIDGERFSFWSPLEGGPVGEAAPLRTARPDQWLDDDEIALRLHRSAGSWELAAYGYDGYWKSPGGFDPGSGLATFPALTVLGASARGPLLGGIANLELGHYDSRDDREGADPMVNNSELRVLAGFELELAHELTGGFQAYLERMLDYDAYRATLPAGAPRDRDRVVLTARLTKLLRGQTLTLSWFSYWSPTDEDGYLRPKVSFKLDDHTTVEAGGNWFFGEEPWTFFGQFERGSNLWASLRFSV